MAIFPFMAPKKLWRVIKRSFSDFWDNNVLKLSAALAFSTIFSLPGLMIIIIWFSNIFYRREVVEGTIYNQLSKFIGEDAAGVIQQAMQNSIHTTGSHLATIVGFAALLIGATSVFGEIQDSINHIWRLKAKPRKGQGWLRLLINRLLSFSMIISLGFILLVSLVINGAMELLINRLLQNFPEITVVIVYVVNTILTFFITAVIFGLIFKVLPDAKIEWRHVSVGAFTTAVFFMIGRFLIGYYLGQSTFSSAYGAAGSIIIFLLWAYYSSMILYFGAIFTREYAIETGSQIYPNQYAVWVEQVEVVSKQALPETTDGQQAKVEEVSESK
jgi:membrane protein